MTNFKQTALLLSLVALYASTGMALNTDEAESPPVLNRGIPASFDPKPSYTTTTDPEDRDQLSDGLLNVRKSGEIATSALWSNKSAVGWNHAKEPIFITFDLGSIQRIGGMMVRSAAGTAGVFWPSTIHIVVSEDGKNWSSAGEIISLSRENGLPPAQGYNEHQFIVDGLNVDGRFVGICVYPGGTPFFFLDELSVYGGDSEKPAEPRPVIGDISAMRHYVKENVVGPNILRRLAVDYSLIDAAIKKTHLDTQVQGRLETELKNAAGSTEELQGPIAPGFRTVIPINKTEEEMLSVYGSMLKEEGYPSMLITKRHRNAYLGWLEKPAEKKQSSVELNFRQMRNEVRGDLLLITNASGAKSQINVAIDVPCEGVSLFYTPWTDTPQLEPVSMALLPVPQKGGGWVLEIPAGLTTKLWVSMDSSDAPAGKKEYRLSFSDPSGTKVDVFMAVNISTITMGTPSLHLGMWDYSNGSGAYQLRAPNRDAAIQLMRSHNLDSPWATQRVLPPIEAKDFDADDELLGPLDFTAFDEWVKMWPSVRRYMIFASVSNAIGSVPMTSPRFAKRVKQWAQAIADHVTKNGLKPEQICLLLVDEPSNNKDDELLVAWAKPLKEGGSGLTIWSDPIWKDPTKTDHPEAFVLPDVLCANWGVLDSGGESQWEFYQGMKEKGKAIEMYMCSAPAPHTDPNRYYRLMPWAGWRLRIQGIGFWAFSDAGGLNNAWSAYDGARGVWYTPVFLGTTDVTNTIQWEAIRDGIQDHEYLVQLEEILPQIKNEKLKKEAAELLQVTSIESLFHGLNATKDFSWRKAEESNAPDQYRERILAVLEEFEGPHLSKNGQ